MKNKELGMKKLIKKALKLILPLVLGGFILYWVYRDFDFVKATEVCNMAQTGGGWLSRFFSAYLHRYFVVGVGARRWSLWEHFPEEGIVLMPFSFRMQLVWLYRG